MAHMASSEDDCIMLLQHGSRATLLHQVTGEIVDVSDRAPLVIIADGSRPMVATVDEDGGVLPAEAGGRCVACSDLFAKECVVRQGVLVVIDKASQSSTPQKKLASACQVKGISFFIPGSGGGQQVCSEVYWFSAPQSAQCCFWVLRWWVDFLGGCRKNFIGDSLPSWRNRCSVFSQFAPGLVAADDHFRTSQLSNYRRADSKGASSSWADAMRPDSDFSCNSFGLLILLASWGGKGVHKSSKWALPHDVVQHRCKAALGALVAKFVREQSTMEVATGIGPALIDIVIGDDSVPLLDLRQFLASDGGSVFRRSKVFTGDTLPLSQFLMVLAFEDTNTVLGQTRRQVAREMLAQLCGLLALIIETTRDSQIWGATSLVQLEQLKSARGYKRSSPAYKQAVIQTVSSAKRLRSVSGFLAAKSVLGQPAKDYDNHNPGDFLKVERYSYLVANIEAFVGARSLSLVADACSAGNDHLLNVVVWHPEKQVAFFCPPQVPDRVV